MKTALSLISALAIASQAWCSPALQADSLYNKEDFRQAAEMYEQSIAVEGPHADTYYNLGNAY